MTTLYVSRKAALCKLRELLEEKEPSNRDVEDALDSLLSHTLYNFSIVNNELGDDDDYLERLEKFDNS